MIHLKYKCKVNFVKLPLIWIDLCLKLVFENATAGRNTGCRAVVNCASCSLHLPLTHRCGLRRSKCDQAMHLALPPSHWPVLLMICDGKNPGPSTSGTSHNKFSKMPPTTSMNLWTRCRVLSVARRSSWRRSFIQTQALLMRATRSAHVSPLVRYTYPFSHPHKQKSKGVKSGERQWIRLPRPIHRLGYVLFRCWVTFLV